MRGQADPFTELFNQPNPNESCEQRESAAPAPQVFTLLNSDQMTDRCIAFALRLQRESDDPARRLTAPSTGVRPIRNDRRNGSPAAISRRDGRLPSNDTRKTCHVPRRNHAVAG
ncbi:MAG: hypothetical protein R3C19_07060 [Planctomycetaceae bacterium]